MRLMYANSMLIRVTNDAFALDVWGWIELGKAGLLGFAFMWDVGTCQWRFRMRWHGLWKVCDGWDG